MKRKQIHVSNCPTCKAFPVQFIRRGRGKVKHKFIKLPPRQKRDAEFRAVVRAFQDNAAFFANVILDARDSRYRP